MTSPTKKKKLRKAMAAFCVLAESNERRWHYSQSRPITGYGLPASSYHVADCSGYVALVFDHAVHTAGAFLVSPLGSPHGWGYTGTELDFLRAHGKRVVEANGYLVGDLAVYGQRGSDGSHTTVCRKAGSASTSVWSSHGSERGPVPVKLNYRDDLLGCWRHPGLL